jgi:hypothetical protein
MRMRVLFASDAAAYRDEVVSVFERHRPHFCMRSVEPGDVTLEALRFRPHLVVFDGADRGRWPTLESRLGCSYSVGCRRSPSCRWEDATSGWRT